LTGAIDIRIDLDGSAVTVWLRRTARFFFFANPNAKDADLVFIDELNSGLFERSMSGS
jgi:hypothetical protein